MTIYKMGSNMTELRGTDKTVFFSYNTPVACYISKQGYFKTEKSWSRTTSKHITQWLKYYGINDSKVVPQKPQIFFDELLNEKAATSSQATAHVSK